MKIKMKLDVNNQLDDFEASPELIENLESYALICLEIEDFPEDVYISLAFVDEETIRELNKTYREKDKKTDVLSFPAWDELSRTLGDVVICVDVARDQAKNIGHSLEDEISYLFIHSIFHLLGYDHIKEEDKKIMRSKEKEALKRGGLRNG